MIASRTVDLIIDRHLKDNENAELAQIEAMIDYNIMMGNLEDPAEEEEPEDNGLEDNASEAETSEDDEPETDEGVEENVSEV